MLTPMMVCMGDRGPDSAGLAIFRLPIQSSLRQFSLFTKQTGYDWQRLRQHLAADYGEEIAIEVVENHAKLTAALSPTKVRSWLAQNVPEIHLLAVGLAIELYKDEGHPTHIAARYHFRQL